MNKYLNSILCIRHILSYCYHLINWISYGLAQIDPIKWRPLWYIVCQKKLNLFGKKKIYFLLQKSGKHVCKTKMTKKLRQRTTKRQTADGILFSSLTLEGPFATLKHIQFCFVFKQIEIARANHFTTQIIYFSLPIIIWGNAKLANVIQTIVILANDTIQANSF